MVVTAAQTAAGGACPSCGRAVGCEDNFCEACGAELAPALTGAARVNATACAFCGQGRIAPDGYCESCGRKAPSGRDHAELDLGLLAGVTDRGLRHHRNEDAMELAVAAQASGPVAVAVLCDGVSRSARPDEASLAAAREAVRVLLAGVRTGRDPAEASRAAVRAARDAVAGLGEQSPDAPQVCAATTFLSAVLARDGVTLCWLGDSRAYWLGAGPAAAARRLTADDSLAGELVTTGLASEQDAAALPQGHVVTGWLGADLSEALPHVTTFKPPGRGALLLCSDGLWNFQPEAAKLAELALPGALSDPLGAAAALVRFALDAGGTDNVTAILAPFPLSSLSHPPGDTP